MESLRTVAIEAVKAWHEMRNEEFSTRFGEGGGYLYKNKQKEHCVQMLRLSRALGLPEPIVGSPIDVDQLDDKKHAPKNLSQ